MPVAWPGTHYPKTGLGRPTVFEAWLLNYFQVQVFAKWDCENLVKEVLLIRDILIRIGVFLVSGF